MIQYPHLFSRLTIKNTTFRNRIFSAPTSMTPSHQSRIPDDKQLFYFEEKARGGAAAVTVSETSISLKYATNKLNGNVALLPDGFGGRCEFMKEASMIARHGAVPSIQLFHAGDTTHPRVLEGRDPIGPNDYTRPDGVHVTGMDEDLMRETSEDFAAAALFIKNSGFKMVMIHGGHGWLFSQFLSPATNWRTDEYGGSIENRARFPLRVLKAVREAVGDDFLIEFRMSGDENMENGITLEDVCAFAKMAEEYVDILHMSAGAMHTTNHYMFPGIFVPHGCNLYIAKAVKQAVTKAKVATVGAYYDPEEMDRIIRDGDADIVYVGRQIIADPEAPNKWRSGRDADVVPCTRCMNCLGRFLKGEMACDVNPTVGQELLNLNLAAVPERKRRVVIIGGGPAGLTAATTAAGRGHDVILLEKEDRLGGMLNLIDHDVHKGDMVRFRDYLIRKVRESGAVIRIKTEATVRLINSLKPDYVLCAVGSEPIIPPIPGLEENSLTSAQLSEHDGEIGERIVIIGGGLTGVETGLSYAAQGKHVTIIEMLDKAAAQANQIHGAAISKTMESLKNNITCLVNAKCVGVSSGLVEVEDKNGRQTIDADLVINALGQKPRFDLVEELSKCDVPIFETIGDCSELAQVRGAVHSGYYRAMDIR